HTALTAYRGTTHDTEHQVFAVSISDLASGGFTFTLSAPIDHAVVQGRNLDTLTFKFVATDADGDSVGSTFDVAIQDDVPTAGDFEKTSREDFAGNFFNYSILTAGADGIASVTGLSAHGATVTFDSDSFFYAPAVNYSGADQVTYTVTDADGDTSTGTIT